MPEAARAPRLGMSYRPELDDFFATVDPALAFCEAHAEAVVGRPRVIERLAALAGCGVAVHLHSTRLALMADDDPACSRELDVVGEVAEAVRAERVSAHLASGEAQVGPIRTFRRPPYSERAHDRVIGRMEEISRRLGRPFAVENIACYGEPIADELAEIEFINRIVRARPMGVVFDVSNHLSNVVNRMGRPGQLHELRVERIAYVHVSGGRWLESTYVDTHGDAVPHAHLRALARLRRRAAAMDVLYERDVRYENRTEIGRDLSRVARAVGAASRFCEAGVGG